MGQTSEFTAQFITDDTISLSGISPSNNQQLVDTTQVLSWTSNADTFDVYLSKNNFATTTQTSIGQTDTTFDPTTLSYDGADYYWKIVGTRGEQTDSIVDSFTTNITLNLDRITPISTDTYLVDTSFELVWSSNSDSFFVKLAKDSGFYIPLVDSSQTDSTLDPTLEYGPTKYYWQVVGIRGEQLDTISGTISTDTTISLDSLSPNLSMVEDTFVTLEWVSNSQSYFVGLYDDDAYTNVIDSATTTEDTFFVDSLARSTDYYWLIEGERGEQKDTSYGTFRMDTGLIINLSSPTNGDVGFDTNTSLQWSGNAHTYYVWVSEVENFSSTIDDITIDTTSVLDTFTFDPSGLQYTLESKKYYWRVQGIRNAQNSILTTYFHTDNLLYINTPYPDSGAVSIDTSVTLTWSDYADRVDIYFGKTDPPSKVDSGVAENYYDPSGLEYDTTYYWIIVGYRGTQKDTMYSDFAIDTTLTLDLLVPANNESSVSASVLFLWSGYAASYDVTKSEISTFSPISEFEIGKTDTTYDPLQLEYGAKKYYWKVGATRGEQTLTLTDSFTTVWGESIHKKRYIGCELLRNSIFLIPSICYYHPIISCGVIHQTAWVKSINNYSS